MHTIITDAIYFRSEYALRDAATWTVIIIYHNPETVMGTALTPARNLLQSSYRIICGIIKRLYLLKPAGVKQPADIL